MSTFIDHKRKVILSSNFTSLMDSLEDIYHIGIEKHTARGSIGFYAFTIGGELKHFSTWQDVFFLLIDKGIAIDLAKSYKTIKRFVLTLTEDIPEQTQPQTLVKAEEKHYEFRIRQDTQEMAKDRVAESLKSFDQQDKTEEKILTGSTVDGSDQSGSEVKQLRKDVENIPWKQFNSPRFSKEAIVSLAAEFGITLEESKKADMIKAFELAVQSL